MRWQGRQGSGNIEDRRGFGGGGKLAVGGGFGIVIAIVVMLLGGDPSQMLNQMQGSQTEQGPVQSTPEEDQAVQFTSNVLKMTEDVWDRQFAQIGQQYRKPKLVIFRSQVQSGCGGASAATGPFYCPADEKVYIDLSFYDDLKSRFGAPGDFAMAYVIAHEIGHHVQNLLGANRKVDEARGQLPEREVNKLSVMLELQADFYSGLWANHAQSSFDILESGDIEEALTAANAIGDDRLQKESSGTVVPDAFTHGTSEQRVRWFRQGFETGDIRQGNTFEASEL